MYRSYKPSNWFEAFCFLFLLSIKFVLFCNTPHCTCIWGLKNLSMSYIRLDIIIRTLQCCSHFASVFQLLRHVVVYKNSFNKLAAENDKEAHPRGCIYWDSVASTWRLQSCKQFIWWNINFYTLSRMFIWMISRIY